MLREAAAEVGLSPSTLRKYIADDIDGLTPSKSVMFGKVQVYLYTREDIERIKNKSTNRMTVRDYQGGGRPRKYTPEERSLRARLFSRRYYWRDKLNTATFMEDNKLVEEAKESLAEIDRAIKETEKVK